MRRLTRILVLAFYLAAPLHAADDNSQPRRMFLRKCFKVLAGLGAVTGYGGYRGYQYWRRSKVEEAVDRLVDGLPAPIQKSVKGRLMATFDEGGGDAITELIGRITEHFEREFSRMKGHLSSTDRFTVLGRRMYEVPGGALAAENIPRNRVHAGFNILLDTSSLVRGGNPMREIERMQLQLRRNGGTDDGSRREDEERNRRLAIGFISILNPELGRQLHEEENKPRRERIPVSRYSEDQFDPISADDLLSGRVPSLCRHRAAILYAAFQHYGIESRVRLGWIGNTSGGKYGNHAWVEVGDQVFDAMNYDGPVDRRSYYREHVRAYIDDNGNRTSELPTESRPQEPAPRQPALPDLQLQPFQLPSYLRGGR